ncbi:hypothetical protein [Leptothoe sp. PORK10 BA2]|uniref:hypothetical protein n=1 Tax=Leptothoe sp. PORK10 BA2 TaxID=3110254 RepID=UPI002B1FA5AB|nr:hypothetical protein [Leptothoe sp. PORK10 BA2]MEA5465085.1 hypothetical protein [Leptothoe sp. PORK10 BA2]
MNIKKNETARCGACRFYTPVGRRGGECSQFTVPVRSEWTSCCLAESPFQKVTKVSNSEIKEINLTKVTADKKVMAESLSLPTGRFAASDKQLAVHLQK